MKNSFSGLSCRLGMTQETISEPEDVAGQTSQTKKQRKQVEVGWGEGEKN
jgi:hypothetical protein